MARTLNEYVDEGEEQNDLVLKGRGVWIESDLVLMYLIPIERSAVRVEFYQQGDDVMGFPRKTVVFDLKGEPDGL